MNKEELKKEIEKAHYLLSGKTIKNDKNDVVNKIILESLYP